MLKNSQNWPIMCSKSRKTCRKRVDIAPIYTSQATHIHAINAICVDSVDNN